MRTWILCADHLSAKVYLQKDSQDEAHLCYTIPRKKEFVRYLSEEIEIACGAGTANQLVVCAERKMLSKFAKLLSAGVRRNVIGTIAKDLCDVPREYLSGYVREIAGIRSEEKPWKSFSSRR